ncbi:MAG: hypothetical protein HKN43_16820 [Rhodothermales bacterium]|nr:hypothetical protein [Rhodothermales bacterium]
MALERRIGFNSVNRKFMSIVSPYDHAIRFCVLTVLVISVAVLTMIPVTSYSQSASPFTVYDAFSDYRQRIASNAELSDLAYARADIAARSGNMQILQEALERIQTLPGGSVDRIIESLSFPFPEGVESIDDRRRFVIGIVFPYLYTDRADAQFVCRQLPTFTYYMVVQGVSAYGSAENAYGCRSGDLMVSSIVREAVSSNTAGSTASWTSALQIESPYGRVYYPDGERFFTAPLDNPAHTLLASAAVANQLDVIQLLLDAGANVDIASDSGFTALHYAVVNDQLDAVNKLLQSGASVSTWTDDGRTALHLAAKHNAVRLFQPLVNAGSEVDLRAAGNDTPLIHGINQRHVESVAALIDLGANIELQTRAGYSPLAHAVRKSTGSVVQLLIDAGANINASDSNGLSVLHHAINSRSPDKVGRVLVAGARVDATSNDGTTALMLASETGQVAVVRMLLGTGADISLVDSDGNNALMRAAASDQNRSVEILLREGARKSVRNKAGQTAKEIARTQQSFRVRKLFKHIKPVHVNYLKTGVNLAKLQDDQHVSSVGGDFGVGIGIALSRRIRVQTDVALTFRNTDVDELAGPVTFPSQGDFYYWINTVDIKPVVRFAVTNPYRSHLYLMAGAGYGSVLIVELRDFSEDLDGEEVTDSTDTSLTYFIAGFGVQTTFGTRALINLELTAASASSFNLDLFEGSLGTLSLNLGFGF